MRLAVKSCGFKYWEYILCYVDDIMVISHKALQTMESIRSKKFKFKNDKIETPTQQSCWAMSSDVYCVALVKTVEGVLEKKGLRLLSRCCTPLIHGYCPELDTTAELNQMVFNGTKNSLVCFAR